MKIFTFAKPLDSHFREKLFSSKYIKFNKIPVELATSIFKKYIVGIIWGEFSEGSF